MFPTTKIFLCGFHLVKSLKTKLIEYVGKANLMQDKNLLQIWYNILKGINWIPWNNELTSHFFQYLRSKEVTDLLWPINVTPWKLFLKYLYKWYFDPKAQFHYRLWDHHTQLLGYNHADCTTNSSESINSVLNRDCGPIKSKPALLAKIYGHKEKFLEKYIHIVKLDNLQCAKRRKEVTERFEILHDLCESYDRFSANERKNNLFKYLGLFSRRDNCPDKYYEETDEDSETETE